MSGKKPQILTFHGCLSTACLIRPRTLIVKQRNTTIDVQNDEPVCITHFENITI